jgi:hypothetical protein
MAYAFSSRRAMAFLMISTMLVGCTADGLMPLESIDTGTRVSSIRPPAPLPGMPVQEGYAAAPQPMAQTYSRNPNPQTNLPPGEVYASADSARQSASKPVTLGAPPAPLGTLTLSSSGAASSAGLGTEGGSHLRDDSSPEDGARVVGLAEEQENDISAVAPRQPMVATRRIASVAPAASAPLAGRVSAAPVEASISPARMAEPVSPDAAEPRWSDQSRVVAPSRPKPEPEQVAMLRPNSPAGALESPRMDAPADGPMPASEISCRRELQRMGVEFRDKPRISDGPSCGIDYPVELSGLSGNIDVKPAVTLNCQTTLAFAKWVKNELAPSSRLRYLTGVKTIEPLGGYSCRRMNNSRQRYNPMSEHARGNAIDVGKFVLKNGHEIDVRKKGLFSFREGALLKAVRSDSCKYFNTVLGPGSNKEHWNHFHFDLRSRATGNRYCD